MLRAGHPTLLTWRGEVRFIQSQDQQAQGLTTTTRSSRIVTECLLTRSMLIKIHVHDIYSRFRAGAILSIGKYEYDFITTVTI